MIHPTLRGYFGARVDGNIKLSNFFDEMRLKRSLRPLRLLRLLRSLRPLRFLMPGNHSVCKMQAVFLIFKVKVIEADKVSYAKKSLSM